MNHSRTFKMIIMFAVSFSLLSTLTACAEETTDTSQAAKSLTGKSATEYINAKEKHIAPGKDPDYNYIHIAKGVISPCAKTSEAPCGFDLYVLGKSNWQSQKGQNQTFYLSEESRTGRIFYGPFSDKLERIVEDLTKLEEKYSAEVVLLEDTEYGLKFTTAKDCENYLSVIKAEEKSANALESYVSILKSPKNWSGPVTSYNIFSIEDHNDFSPDTPPGRPRTLLILNDDLLLTQWDPEEEPSAEELPLHCRVKTVKTN